MTYFTSYRIIISPVTRALVSKNIKSMCGSIGVKWLVSTRSRTTDLWLTVPTFNIRILLHSFRHARHFQFTLKLSVRDYRGSGRLTQPTRCTNELQGWFGLPTTPMQQFEGRKSSLDQDSDLQLTTPMLIRLSWGRLILKILYRARSFHSISKNQTAIVYGL